MEQISVLIIEYSMDHMSKIKKILEKILISLEVDYKFFEEKRYEESKELIKKERFDIILLSDTIFGSRISLPLIEIIKEYNTKALTFYIYSNRDLKDEAVKLGLKFCFKKKFSITNIRIIKDDDVNKITNIIKETYINKKPYA